MLWRKWKQNFNGIACHDSCEYECKIKWKESITKKSTATISNIDNAGLWITTKTYKLLWVNSNLPYWQRSSRRETTKFFWHHSKKYINITAEGKLFWRLTIKTTKHATADKAKKTTFLIGEIF